MSQPVTATAVTIAADARSKRNNGLRINAKPSDQQASPKPSPPLNRPKRKNHRKARRWLMMPIALTASPRCDRRI